MWFKAIALSLVSFAALNFLSALLIRAELSAKVRFERVNGVTVAYRVYAPPAGASNRSGEHRSPVVLLHGFGGASSDWFFIVEELSKHATCICIDIPPFGLSEKSGSFDYSDGNIVKTLVHLLDRIGVERFSLVGHSMGGFLSLMIASTFPERVDRLVLLSAAYGMGRFGSDGSESNVSDTENQSVASPLGPSDGIDRALVTLLDVGLRLYPVLRFAYEQFQPSQSAYMSRQVDHLFAQNYFLPAGVLVKFAEDKLKQRPYEHDLSRIRSETLIVYGENDRVTPPSIGEFLNKKLRNSRYELIPDEGHLPLFNERVRALVVDFLVR